MPEILAYQMARNTWVPRKGSKIPMMLKNGVKRAFNNFDEYQFAKYNRDGLVSIKDALFLTHPKAKTPEQQKLFDKIAEDTLEIPETWETYISVNGSNTNTWSHIASKLPIFALVRNLRNLLKHDIDTSLYLDKLTTPKVIHNSRMFPFRFYSAYKVVRDETIAFVKQRTVLDALEQAMDISIENMPHISGDTAIFVDLSGSMTSSLNRNSTVRYIDIASLFGALSDKICDNSIIGVFGQTFDTVNVSKRLPILAKMDQIRNKRVGHATNAYLAVEWLRNQGIKVDRILIFSDMQTYDSRGWGNNSRSVQAEIIKYRRQINQNTFLHTIDLTGYGTTLMPEDDPKTNIITGWSEKILDYINMFEEGFETMAKKIENYEVV